MLSIEIEKDHWGIIGIESSKCKKLFIILLAITQNRRIQKLNQNIRYKVQLNVNNMIIDFKQDSSNEEHKNGKAFFNISLNFTSAKQKLLNQTISVVKEVDESKEVSKIGDESKARKSINNSNHSMVKKSSSKISERYTFVSQLGQGGYAKVMKIEAKSDKSIRACKIQSK